MQWWSYMMESDLNLAQPFIILTFRHWKGWDAVNCPNKLAVTKSWCQKWNTGQAYFNPTSDLKHVVVTIWEFRYQSQPSWTIQYTDDETLGGLRCNEILRSIQTYSILVWNVGGPGAEIVPTRDWKVRVWWWLYMLNINLNLAQPFNIPTMRHWKS